MRSIQTTSGTRLELDGDVLAVIEAVSRDLMRSRALDYGFDEVDREFSHLVSQMSEEELRAYLKESLFMSFNRYENEHLAELIRKASQVQDEGRESEE